MGGIPINRVGIAVRFVGVGEGEAIFPKGFLNNAFAILDSQ